jgi:parvulin-like peptidyl-prolyl isomerase
MTHRWKKLPLLVFLALGGAFLAAQQVVEEIVAVVNDDIITVTEFKKVYEIQVADARGQLKGEELEKVLEQIKTGLLDSMINNMLLLQLAKEQNISVTDRLKSAVDSVIKENNLESEDDLKRALKGQGYEYDAWLKMIEERILRETVAMREINKSIALDEADIIEYYRKHAAEFTEPEEYKLRAVFLSLLERADEAQEARKAEIDAKLKEGLDFTKAAEDYSDPPLKEQKGDLGKLRKGEIDKTLEAAVAPLKAGELSGWVQNRNGWYRLKLEEKTEPRRRSFEECKRDIEQSMMRSLQDQKMNEFIRDLRGRSFIKILKPNPLG